MDSLYGGGHEGISFVLKATFSSIEQMVAKFKLGPDYTDVWYGEYCLVSTPNLNDRDNGKVFRRGLNFQLTNGDAQEVGQIVGPSSGTPMIQMNTLKEASDKSTSAIGIDDVRTYPYDYTHDAEGRVTGYSVREDKNGKSYDNNGDLITDSSAYPIKYFPFSVPHDTSLVPGKKADGTFNDEIRWTWVNIRKPNQDSASWYYVGFEIPYLVSEYVTHMVSPYDVNGNLKTDATTATRVDDQTHPFYMKWDFGLPKGIKGDSLRNLRVITPTNAIRNTIYQPTALNVDAATGEVTFGATGYPGLDDDITNARKILVYDIYVFDKVKNPQPALIYLGDYNFIDAINVSDNGTLTIGFTHDSDYILNRKIKWVSRVSLDANTGIFQLDFNNGDSSVIQQLDWVDNIIIDETTGEIIIHHVNKNVGNNGNVSLGQKLKLITGANVDSTGVMTFETNTGDDFTVKQKGTNNDFKIKIIENVILKQALADDKRIQVKFNTNTTNTPIGDPINFVQDMVVRDSDFHLLVLFNDPTHRAAVGDVDVTTGKDANGVTWVNNVQGSDGINTGPAVYWRDYGTIKDQSGLLIGMGITSDDIKGFDSVTAYLDKTYPSGLTEGATKQKVVVYTPTNSTQTEYYAFDYNTYHWFFIGTLSESLMRDAKLIDASQITNDILTKVSTDGVVLKIVNTSGLKTSAIPKYWSQSYKDWK